MGIEFRGIYSKGLLRKAIALANAPSRLGMVLRIILLLTILALLVAFVLGGLANGNWDIRHLVKLSLSLPVLAYVLLFPYVGSWWTASQLWRDGELRGQVSGTATGGGVTMSYQTTMREFRWEDYARVRRNADMVVLITAGGDFSIHPRSFFRDDVEWGSFLQLIELNVVEAR